jgi:hypothetical protein
MADYKHAVASGGDAVASRPVNPSRLARQISNRLTITIGAKMHRHIASRTRWHSPANAGRGL